MKKYISILILALIIAPSIAFASWWNPFSWKVFKKRAPTPQSQVVNIEKEKTSEEKISDLQKQINELNENRISNKILENKVVNKSNNISIQTSKNKEVLLDLNNKYITSIDSNISILDAKIIDMKKYLSTWEELRSSQETINTARGVDSIDKLNDALLDLEKEQIVKTTNEINKFIGAKNTLSQMRNDALNIEIPKLKAKNTVSDTEFNNSIVTLNDYSVSIGKLMNVMAERYDFFTQTQIRNFSLVDQSIKAIMKNINYNTSNNTLDNYSNLSERFTNNRPITCSSSSAFGVTYTICN